MKEQMPVECETCGANSKKMPVIVYAGHLKCWNCLAMAGLSRLRDNTYTAEEAERIMKGRE